MPVQSLSIVIPCLNESDTIGDCILKAQKLLAEYALPGEVIVADNGSSDNSRAIAIRNHAEVLDVKERGYGSALHQGILHARSEYILFADADDSYHFDEGGPFIEAFNQGYEVVIGNRYLGGIEKGAMPFLHKYLGTPVFHFWEKDLSRLTWEISTAVCAGSKNVYDSLEMKSGGMEYATEFIAKAAYKNKRSGKCRSGYTKMAGKVNHT
jgi:glycosyltransferase involved in cell wall biosynthesis